MKKQITQEDINIALNNASENGYLEELSRTPESIAQDLVEYTAQFEDSEPSSLIPLIKFWQEAQRNAPKAHQTDPWE